MDQLLILPCTSPGYCASLTATVILHGRTYALRHSKVQAMRVIAGKYRGRSLRSLRGMDTRPTSDRLRETLFNVLTAGNPEALAGTVWLDLFAGTGAVGIEALSRGARQVYFVETAAAAGKLIEKK